MNANNGVGSEGPALHFLIMDTSRRALDGQVALVTGGAAGTGGVVVTVQDTGGDFGLGGCEPLAAWAAGLPGLVKTAAQEWPAAGVRAL